MMERRLSPATGRVLAVFVAVLLVAGAVGVLWFDRGHDQTAQAGTSSVGTPVRVDRPAPRFTQPLLAQQGFLDLATLRGHVVVVNFWASWCTACRSEMPQLEQLWTSYG